MPFARGSFRYAMCSDAFQYIWTKRQFIGEMGRLVDNPEAAGAVVINHTHNQLTWSPSHGQPLAPAGYRELFEIVEPRIFAESQLFNDVVRGGPLDLSRGDTEETLNSDPALTLIASRHSGVFRRHPVDAPSRARGEFRLNPLYEVERQNGQLRLRLRFPSPDYEDEYGACRQYLPEETLVDAGALDALQRGGPIEPLEELIRRRVIVDLPKRYY
jgi:hypothetical protein